jgi:uncharacterized membrane protein YgcG
MARITMTLIAVVAIGWFRPAGAVEPNPEHIASFTVDVVVNADGSADFTEIIEYDFGVNARHGIDRILITTQRFDEQNDRRYPLDVIGVGATDASAAYAVSSVGNGRERIRIGDPNRTTSGSHAYTIRYRLDGVVNPQTGPDELFWNITGHEWGVPIDRVDVTVHVGGGATQLACFAGSGGSTDPCGLQRREADGTATFGHEGLAPYQGVTAVVGIPDTDGPGVEPQPILVGRTLKDPFSLSKAFARTPATILGASALALVLAGLIARLQWRIGRDRRAIGAPTDVAFAPAGAPNVPVALFEHRGSPVEFVPPDGIRPGQIGVLVDETADTVDVSATIVDLAVRGFLRIEEIPDAKGRVKNYRFVRLPKSEGLLGYESYLVTELFATGPSVELADLKNKFASKLSATKTELYKDVVAQGWFETRPDQVRMLWHFLGLVATVAGGLAVFFLARYTHLALLGIPLAAGGLAVFIGARWMPRRTAKGTGAYRRALGFKDFIDNSEKHRAQWAERVHLFPEYLPYAIAFGATEKWARTFESLGAPPPNTGSWYVGTNPFVWSAFGAQMGSFSASTATTLTSTPGGSGSSGFSGGGFSGGGGGGGGGGSW